MNKQLTCVFLFSAFTTEGYPSTSFCTIATILDVCVVEKGSHIFSEITVGDERITPLCKYSNTGTKTLRHGTHLQNSKI